MLRIQVLFGLSDYTFLTNATPMTVIGNFRYDRASDCYVGEVITLIVDHHRVFLRPIRKWTRAGPDYRVIVETPVGSFKCGQACKREHANRQPCLSVTLKDPITGGTFCGTMLTAADDTATLVLESHALQTFPADLP